MTDHDLDLLLGAWYRSELDQVDAPTSLREAVARIPAGGRPVAGARFRRITLLVAAALAILTVAALLAIGAGWLPRRDATSPSPPPSPVVASASPDAQRSDAPAPETGSPIELDTTTVAAIGEDRASVDLAAIVEGPGGAPFVLDHASQAVIRIDPIDGSPTTILRAGDRVDGTIIGAPQVMTVGGDRLLVLDDHRALWAWRADGGAGTLVRLILARDGVGREDVAVAGTFCRDTPDCRFNNLYLVDPSDRMIWAYAPAADTSGYPALPSAWLLAPRDVDGSTSLLVDGDLYLAHRGEIVRLTAGDVTAWAAGGPGSQAASTSYRFLTSASPRAVGTLLAFDEADDRVVALAKPDGQVLASYVSRAGDPDIARMRGMAVGRSFWWIDPSAVYRSSLRAPDHDPASSPRPSDGG